MHTDGDGDRHIRANIAAHERVAARYVQEHGEIYNDVEQQRLHERLAGALALLPAGTARPTAVDIGCGAGNLTAHLLDLGCSVIAADVTPSFLAMVERTFGQTGRLRTVRLNGRDLTGLDDASADLVAAYSVLHHIPDYLATVREMARVVRPGGLIYLDHEGHPATWLESAAYQRYCQAAAPPRPPRWRRLHRWDLYLDRLHLLFDPRYTREGDLHVWPDDHIEFELIEAVLTDAGCEVVDREDYLQYRRGYDRSVWSAHRGQCVDQRLLVARRRDDG